MAHLLTSADVRTLNADGTKTAWKKVEAPPDTSQPASASKQLYLARHNQAEDEPFHWSLETADVEGGGLEGNVYQVSGDAEFMDYRPNQVRRSWELCSLLPFLGQMTIRN